MCIDSYPKSLEKKIDLILLQLFYMTTLAEAYKELPISLKHIIPLDFDSIKSFPDSHYWPETAADDEFSDYPSETFTADDENESYNNIPVIDLLAPNAAELIGHACEEYGIFRLINHSVPMDLMDEMECLAWRLFGLSMEEKMKVLRTPSSATGYGVARIQPFFSKFMWHEGFTIIGSPAEHAREIWPSDYDLFCDVVESYQNHMKALSYELLVLMLNSLRLSEDVLTFTSSMAEDALQLNSYPPCPNPENAMGLAVHTDSMFFTVLHQSDTKGLEIFRDGMGWITVPPVAGTLVVNVGDLLHICSNGRFHNVKHRVLVNQERHRYSFAYFYGPPANSEVAPFLGLSCPRFQALTVKDFLVLKSKYLEKTVSMITIPADDD